MQKNNSGYYMNWYSHTFFVSHSRKVWLSCHADDTQSPKPLFPVSELEFHIGTCKYKLQVFLQLLLSEGFPPSGVWADG